MHTKLSLALSLGLCVTTAQAAPAPQAPQTTHSPAVASLLERAKLWGDRNRPQLARETLEKLFRIAPDHPDGLATLALIEVQADRPTMAKAALDRLRQAHPDHPAIARIEMQLRLTGTDKNRLEQVRKLARQARQQNHPQLRAKALAAYRELFAPGAPEGDLALEYWLLMAEDWDAWEPAKAGLVELVRQHPDNLRYRYALAEHETLRLPMKRQALQIIIDMTRLPEFERQARAAWRRAMLRLDPSAEHIRMIEEYLQREPTDSALQDRLKSLVVALETRKLAPAVAAGSERPLSPGLALLDKGQLEQAEEQLTQELQGRPSDPDLIGGMGLLRLRQGHHAPALGLFQLARRLQPDQADKWQSLADTARFWGLLREAADARSSRELALAEDKLREAMAINAREPQTLIALARVNADQQSLTAAEDNYRRALALDPVNVTALEELIELLVRDGRRPQAHDMIAGLTPAQRQALGRNLALLQAGMLRAEADAFTSAGMTDEAISKLEEAIRLDGDNVWLRYDLGRLYLLRKEAPRAFALFDDMLARQPGDAAARYALALLQSSADQEPLALSTLEQIASDQRDDKLTRYQRELWVGLRLQQVRQALRSNRPEMARQMLDGAERALGIDPGLSPQLARGWADAGDTRRALRLYAAMRQEGHALTPDNRLAEAIILAEAGQLQAVNERIAKDPTLAEQPALLRALAAAENRRGQPAAAEVFLRRLLAQQANPAELAALQVEIADTLIAAGRPDAALQEIDQWLGMADTGKENAGLRPSTSLLNGASDRGALLQARMRALRAMGAMSKTEMAAEAEKSLRRVLAVYPAETSARAELVRLLLTHGREQEAAAELTRELALPLPDDIVPRIALAEILADFGRSELARNVVDTLREAAPNHARLLQLSGRIAQLQGREDEAMAILQRGFVLEQTESLAQANHSPSRLVVHDPAPSGRIDAEIIGPVAVPLPVEPEEVSGNYGLKQLAGLIDKRASWLSLGYDQRERIGTNGISSFLADEAYAEVALPIATGGNWFMRADTIRIDAGKLDMGRLANVRQFGSMALCANTGCPVAENQIAQGIGLALGWQKQDRRIDLGLTPTNFAVSNWVGGIADKGDWGPFSWSADFSRRALTSSLLSWAGTRDPRTGETWGGVVATGLRLGLSHDTGGSFGFWSSLGQHALTGKNVEDNTRTQLMAGGYWRVVNRENQMFSVGLTGMNWRFAKNAGEYTFGHGGYYSPASYQSLAVPFTWAQRFMRFSYVVRASASVSRAKTDAADYFPTSAALQAAAVAGGINASYAATPDNAPSSRGWSLHLSGEYQLDPSLFLGGRIEIERSPDYAPDRFMFYLRYNLDRPAALPVPLIPEAFKPYSQF